ncbi:MAG: hypothetical protein ACI4MG_03040 [Aristaeellaceae bacterium]
MEQYSGMYGQEENQGSIGKGLIGALLGAIIGALLWGVVGILTQRVFALLGLALGFIIAKGYDLLKGREGAAKIVIISLCVILAVVLGEAVYYVGSIEMEYAKLPEYIAEELAANGKSINDVPQAILKARIPTKEEFYNRVLQDDDFKGAVVKDLLQALFFAAIGAVGVIANLVKKKEPATAEARPDAAYAQDTVKDSDDDTSAAV